MRSDPRIKAIVLVTDAYGGRGGIASYNRNLLRALCNYPMMERVVASPRKISYELEMMPDNLDYDVRSAGSKLAYAYAGLRTAFSYRRFDLSICAHIRFLRIAWIQGHAYRWPIVPGIFCDDV